jgi:pimeloyl-ACP methyl ester carboxylesterase
VKLAAQGYGEGGDRPPLLIAHGLFGSARNWGVIARRLVEGRRVVAVDMRNHGESPWSATHDYKAMAGDLAEAIDGQWDVLGHSMGGKAAMVLALTAPEKVARLVVADIAPVAYGHTQAHLVEAMEGLDVSRIGSRGEADAALAAAVDDPGVRAFLLQSLDLRERRWRLNLEALAAEMPKILSFPEVSGRFEGPALFLSGATSSYVLPEHRPRIKAPFPAARFAKIPGAGHWLHAEKPREFVAAVDAFLARD